MCFVFGPAFPLPTPPAPHLFFPRASVCASNLNICRTLISTRLERRGIADVAETPSGCSKSGRRGPIPLLRVHGGMRPRVYECMCACAAWRKRTPRKNAHAYVKVHPKKEWHARGHARGRTHACAHRERASERASEREREREREKETHTRTRVCTSPAER